MELSLYQRFGSTHTKQKLDILAKYLPAYTTALQSRFTLHYIDAFAGTGVCHIKVDGERLMVPGSASVALGCTPSFHRMAFIEESRRKARALERMRDAAPSHQIEVIQSDANAAVPHYLARLNARVDRAIVFLDPFGMQVQWTTLERIAESKLADLWYLFPLSGLYRQATHDPANIDADKAAALTRVLGTDEWRKQFYATHHQQDLFTPAGIETEYRAADYMQMLAWVRKRLESIFAAVHEPKILHQRIANGRDGPPLFALFFAISNPGEKAKALAMRIVKGVLNS